MSLGCARCGKCCDPVFIDFDVWTGVLADARRYDAAEVVHWGDQWTDRVFIAANMRPVGAYNDQVMLRCRYFDEQHRECRAYGERPPMCRSYPWYGCEPGGEAANRTMLIRDGEPCCSYMADVPPSERPEGARPLIPLTVVTHAASPA